MLDLFSYALFSVLNWSKNNLRANVPFLCAWATAGLQLAIEAVMSTEGQGVVINYRLMLLKVSKWC